MRFGTAAMSPATCISLLALAVVTPLSRDARLFGVSANGLAACAIGGAAAFALLGARLRPLRFDIGAPLPDFSGPGAVAAGLASFARGAGRPGPWLGGTRASRRGGAGD